MTLTNAEFYIIEPAEATNEVTNPSVELATTGYTAYGAGVSIARTSTYQRRGTYALDVTTAANVASGVYFGTVNEVNGVERTFSVDVKGTAGQAMRIGIYTTAGAALSTTTFTATGNWQRVKVTRTGNASTTRRLYVIRDSVNSTAHFYTDGWYYSTVDGTYLDGDMRGFITGRTDYRWNGTAHASTSWRSGDTRSGGTLLAISDYARILTFFGLGMASVLNIAHPMSIDRSSYQTTHALDREFILNLAFSGTHDEMQADRAVIIDAIQPDRVTVKQPLIIRYQGLDSSGNDASEPLDIYAHYVDGLEGNPDNPAVQKAQVRFVSYLPFIAKAGDSGKVLGYQTTVSNFGLIGYRDTDGTWKAMGTGIGGGAKPFVWRLAVGLDGSVYAGGTFTGAGGVANTANVARWDGSAWNEVGGGLNGSVRALAVGPDGSIYAGGAFTDAGGVAGADGIAKWDGANWTALGTGASVGATVWAIAFGPDGTLYAGGDFTAMGGVAGTANVAKWDGANWTALGTPPDNTVLALAVALDGTLYVGGNFANAGGSAASGIASWDGSAWAALGDGVTFDPLGDGVLVATVGTDGQLYVGGMFTDAGGVDDTAYIARWNGTAWQSVGVLDDIVYGLYSYGGALYVGGAFTTANGIALPDHGAVWANGVWSPLDINVQDATAYFTSYIVDAAGRLYVGGSWSGTDALSATVTASNAGGVRAYPVLTVTGPGTVYQLKNYTTGKAVYFDGLTLQAGEKITLDLRQGRFKFSSSWRGNLVNYLAPGSDLDWFLNGGSNNVSLLMIGTTGASAAVISWQDLYWSIDGGKY